jgi:hypothetical protein
MMWVLRVGMNINSLPQEIDKSQGQKTNIDQKDLVALKPKYSEL